jgi:RNA polymerase sigma factor (sigma-70 family)
VKRDNDKIYQEWLVLRCQRGEMGAFEEIVQRWEKPLHYYVRQLVSSEADAWDVLQRVWVKAFRGIPSLRQARCLSVWLYRIAHGTAMSQLRQAYSQPTAWEDCESLAQEVDVSWNAAEAEEVHYGLSQIALPLREVLTLHFLEGLSVLEIAVIVGVPQGTVKSRLYRAKNELRKVLKRERSI